MRKYTIYVNYDCRTYIENVKAKNTAEATQMALRIGYKFTNHGNTGWFEGVRVTQGWRGDKPGLVYHTPKEEDDYVDDSDTTSEEDLVRQGVSRDAARFILYGPESEYEECPDLE